MVGLDHDEDTFRGLRAGRLKEERWMDVGREDWCQGREHDFLLCFRTKEWIEVLTRLFYKSG